MQQQSAFRVFAFSAIVTLGGLVTVLAGLGPAALLTTLVLVVIEVVFSFDNAIVNAKILGRLSRAWQQVFLTIGIVIAIFAMRLLFPLIIVSLTAHLGLSEVWNMALRHPHEYAAKLTSAHPLISAFGGVFLLLLTFEFFLNGQHEVVWWDRFEKRLKRFRSWWLPAGLAIIIVVALAFMSSHHGGQIAKAGLLGIVTFIALQGLTALLSHKQPEGKGLVGWAALALFVYLEVLDASFSFDGVIGAFAITDKVVLIAIGLGIGALWVRSLTVYMVRRGTLDEYIYLEHGAYYTIGVLALALLLSLFVEVPDIITGIIGLGIIGSALVASVQARKQHG